MQVKEFFATKRGTDYYDVHMRNIGQMLTKSMKGFLMNLMFGDIMSSNLGNSTARLLRSVLVGNKTTVL